jgi:hypothetical protein
MVVLVLLGGCGSGDSETSLSDSITDATWLSAGNKLVVFEDDGAFGVGRSPFNDVSAADTEWGTWSVEASVLSMTPDAESPKCAEVTGTYSIDVVDDGNRIDATVQDDPCSGRRADFSEGLTRLDDAES